MLASELIKALERKIAEYGDIPVVLLDDESGYFEPMAGMLYTNIEEPRLEFVTEQQAGTI